jgi:hypothetical protein
VRPVLDESQANKVVKLHTPSTSTSEESYEPPSSVGNLCEPDSANKKRKVEGRYSERCSSCIVAKHSPGLGAELPNKIDLGALSDGSTVDVTAFAEESVRRDLQEAVQITNESGSATVFIDSAPGELLPAVQQGDCVLLRNFFVGSIDRELCLLSQQGSSWCIIRQGFCSKGIRGTVGEEKEDLGPSKTSLPTASST